MMQVTTTVDGRAEYAAREELGAAAVAFEEARYRRDRALRVFRKLRDAVDRDEHEGAV